MPWHRELPVFLLLLTFSVYGCVLLLFRFVYTDTTQHAFFVWNLFLAWIPYGLSLLTQYFFLQKKMLLTWMSGIIWLLFYPNAPYLLTDLLHMKLNPYAPIWFELLFMMTFAIIGLCIGYVSLEHIRRILEQRFTKLVSWIFASALLFLTSFGIYLGRFLRWNSWNILTHPLNLLTDILQRFFIPFGYPQTWEFTFITFGFLFLFHVTMFVISRSQRIMKS